MAEAELHNSDVWSTECLVLNTRYSANGRSLCSALVAAALLVFTGASHAQTKSTDQPPTFTQIRAIFAEKCLACHGNDPKELKGDYDLRTREAAIKGGESGEAAIEPGQPEKSPLYRAITWEDDNLQMPPKANDRLSADQIAVVRRWIADGARWEEPVTTSKTSAGQAWSGSSSGIKIATSGGRSADWDNRTYDPEAVWAYQPLKEANTPLLPSLNPIDSFLLTALRAKGVSGFAPPADPQTLLRRLTFDLTGLPPKPLDLENGSKDEADVERLLSSSQYGEQQARHWLDVVRYADTAGFSNDFERPNSWRYRDYVIRSFNADKPFDRFILEQLAGDELDPSDAELAIAVGYLRMGPWEHTGMTVAAVTRQQYLDDVTNHIGVSLLGQGLRCAACHDHKFDPVPTRDYYRIQAVFSPVQFVERPTPYLPNENVSGFESAKALVEQRLAQLQEAQAALRKKNRDAIAAFLAEKGVKSISDLPAEQRPKEDYLGGTFGLSKTDLSLRKIYQKSQAYLERELKRFEPYALSVYSGPSNGYTSIKQLYDVPSHRDGIVPVVYILPGGSLASPADEVTPGVLSAMFASNDRFSPSERNSVPTKTEGRRL